MKCDLCTERDRRPGTDELNRLFRCFDENERLTLPMMQIVKFAVATAMRLDEICRVEWTDLDVARRMLLIIDTGQLARGARIIHTISKEKLAGQTTYATVDFYCGYHLFRYSKRNIGRGYGFIEAEQRVNV